jgi:hypothetical protein
MDQPQSIQCVNCQTVTTSDGKTVWVCENCGSTNQPVTTDPAAAAQDVASAQAALDQAASQLGSSAPMAPVAPVPETSTDNAPTTTTS